jgi:hypothetical protein
MGRFAGDRLDRQGAPDSPRFLVTGERDPGAGEDRAALVHGGAPHIVRVGGVSEQRLQYVADVGQQLSGTSTS